MIAEPKFMIEEYLRLHGRSNKMDVCRYAQIHPKTGDYWAKEMGIKIDYHRDTAEHGSKIRSYWTLPVDPPARSQGPIFICAFCGTYYPCVKQMINPIDVPCPSCAQRMASFTISPDNFERIFRCEYVKRTDRWKVSVLAETSAEQDWEALDLMGYAKPVDR